MLSAEVVKLFGHEVFHQSVGVRIAPGLYLYGHSNSLFFRRHNRSCGSFAFTGCRRTPMNLDPWIARTAGLQSGDVDPRLWEKVTVPLLSSILI